MNTPHRFPRLFPAWRTEPAGLFLLTGHGRRLCGLLAMNGMAMLSQLAAPLAMGAVIDGLVASPHPSAVGMPQRLAVFIGASLATVLLKHAASRQADRLGVDIAKTVRMRLQAHLLHIRLIDSGRLSRGEVTSLVTEEPEYVARVTAQAIPFFLVQTLIVTVVAGLLMMKAPILGLVTLLPFAVLAAAAIALQGGFVTHFRRNGERLAEVGSHTAQALDGLATIKIFNGERRWKADFEHKVARHGDGEGQVRAWLAVHQSLQQLAAAAVIAIVWYLGIFHSAVFDAGRQVGDLVAISALVALLFQPLVAMTEIASWVPRGLAAGKRINALLALPTEPPGVEAPVLNRPVPVTFKAVSFGYDPGRLVLKGLDLTIAPGESLGIAGSSGIGKSTFIQLITGGYAPVAGNILIDGQPIERLGLHAWRRSVGVVLQDTILFDGTILDNLRCGRDWLTDGDLEAAARKARAHDFIRALPHGYRTRVDGGLKFSGGERQRLGIARAIAARPPFLIFDEATSALDPETERAILDEIDRLAARRTVVFISHRPSPLRRAKRVVLLTDDGRFVPAPSNLVGAVGQCP